jgi:hypothetical protein
MKWDHEPESARFSLSSCEERARERRSCPLAVHGKGRHLDLLMCVVNV